jgi:hypothetical protein
LSEVDKESKLKEPSSVRAGKRDSKEVGLADSENRLGSDLKIKDMGIEDQNSLKEIEVSGKAASDENDVEDDVFEVQNQMNWQ